MSNTLFIRLARVAGGPVQYAATAADARSAAREGTLDEALALAGGRRLVLLAPQSEIRLTSVELAVRDPRKLLQAVPYALEDQFAEDVETLHFAVGARGPNGRTPVAVVARATLDEWLGPFRERGLRPDLLTSDLFGLPWDDSGSWSALAESDRVTVRSGAAAGFICDPSALDSYLQLAIAPEGTGLSLHICNGSAHDFTRLSRSVDLRPGWPLALDCLMANLRTDTALNLLQGAYSPRRDLQQLWQPWRVAAGLATAWLLVALVNAGIGQWQERAELKRIEDANLQRFTALFPAETRIVDMAVQAEQQLAQRKGGGGPAGVFPLLEAAAQGLATESSLSLQSLQFREGALFLSLSGNDLQSLDRLRAWYGKRSGVALEVQAANASSLGVQIRLKLSPA